MEFTGRQDVVNQTLELYIVYIFRLFNKRPYIAIGGMILSLEDWESRMA